MPELMRFNATAEKYFATEQLKTVQERREQVGDEYLRQAPADWAELIALVRVEMDKGIDPRDVKVQALAKRWLVLPNECTAGDPGVEQSLTRRWEEQGDNLAA